MSKPSDGMTLDELRDEFDWMFEFQSRMAERIRQDADVHNLVDYVTGLEVENAALRELMADMWRFMGAACKKYPRLFDPAAQGGQMVQPNMIDFFEQRMRELGIEVEG